MTREAVATRSTNAGRDADEIELVLAFLNTLDVEARTDVLDDPAAWQHWCDARELPATASVESARDLRARLRAAVTHTDLPNAVDDHQHWRTEVVLSDGVPTLIARDALSGILNSAVHLAHIGAWPRIKICPAEDCLEAFYDRSRNRSRTWCSMNVCGNREKARSWRERHVSP